MVNTNCPTGVFNFLNGDENRFYVFCEQSGMSEKRSVNTGYNSFPVEISS